MPGIEDRGAHPDQPAGVAVAIDFLECPAEAWNGKTQIDGCVLARFPRQLRESTFAKARGWIFLSTADLTRCTALRGVPVTHSKDVSA